MRPFKDFVLGKHDQGGLSQARHQRHHKAHVHWHLKWVAQRLGDLLRRRRFARLILAGPEEPTSELRRLLPRVLASRVVAVIPAEMFAEQGEILEKAREVERRIERKAEERLLRELLDLAGPGGKSTLGVRPTLDALWADMVQTLVLAHDVHGSGSECTNCGRLEPGTRDACPTCGKTMQPLHDLFHRAMARVREQAGSVEVMHGVAARRLMDEGEGLGALLRYRRPATQAAGGAASSEGTGR
jgi:peptide subunit release factor 1 (eRF1)